MAVPLFIPPPILRGRAFSLVELLIVLAVLVILATLLIPGLGRMKATAQGARCAANLRQLGSAVAAYAGEHDGAFPRGGWMDSGGIPFDPPGIDGIGWLADIYPYTGEQRDVFVCPSGKDKSPTGLTSWIRMPGGSSTDPKFPFHYAYNAHLNSNRTNLRNFSTYPGTVDRMASVRNLSGLPVLIDIVFQNNFAGEFPVFEPTPPPGNGRVFADRHGKTGNVLWGDGHVSAMTYDMWVSAPSDRISTGAWKNYRFCTGNY
ncbi:MAG: DUF1559 domain-containing protein [Chthoniobacterales bacterium]|nr:DUF1559 domain-containing protein [Chthoniobacterales bacterium]